MFFALVLIILYGSNHVRAREHYQRSILLSKLLHIATRTRRWRKGTRERERECSGNIDLLQRKEREREKDFLLLFVVFHGGIN